MPADDVSELTPKDMIELTDAFSNALRLLLLDKVWTREAARASGATRDPARVAELGGVIDQVDLLLRQVQDSAARVAAIADRTGLLQSRFDALVNDAPPRGVSADRLSVITKRLRHHVSERANGDTARYMALAAGVLESRVGPEIDEIRAEFRRVADAGSSDGDMSEETQEAVGAIAIGAGLLLGPEAAGAVIVVAEVVDCLFG